ncbi:uncharacterized protein [Henckelia pumila]|uniref:uncharacterized protein n=1 Tax=Henckelia pumila TaxID=405737 RepID=UPI003C6E945D
MTANLSLRQLGTLDMNQQPLCIIFFYSEANATFNLKSGLIHLLPSFHGLVGEDPHKNLIEFHVICTSMKPAGVTEKQIQLRAFPFSLKNAAKDWLYYLPPGSITTWTEIKMIFLDKFFPDSRAANIRKVVYGLLPHDRSMVNAASGVVFADKTPKDARNLIENMAANSKKFGTSRGDPMLRRNNEVNVSSLEQQLINLTSLVRQLAVGNGKNVKKCGICAAAMGHSTETCPTLQEGSTEQVNAPGGFLGHHSGIMTLTRTRIIQTVPNPKENVSAINVRSGKDLMVREEVVQARVKNENDKESKVEENEIVQKDTPKRKFPPLSEYKPVAPFSLALKEYRKDEGIKELYDTFRRCEELYTAKIKQKLKGCQKFELGEQVSIVIQRKIPIKCKDTFMFSIHCKIGDVQLDTTMLDLGASINVMSYSTYDSLKLGPLNETVIVIQMTDRSNIYPRSVLEDVLVKVGNLVFPADFYVLHMKNNDLNSPILLRRPFLKTSKSIIDVNNGTLTMEFNGVLVKLNIFDNLKFPSCESVVNTPDINDHLSQENKKVVNGDMLKKVAARPANNSNAKIFLPDLQAPKAEPKLPQDRAK